MLPEEQTVRFGLYTADLHTAELRKGQAIVPLQNLPFRILKLLLRAPGHVVTREQMRHELWPEGTFVDFERGISTAVSKLREALGDSASNPRFIETVGRRGYRFIAPVSEVTNQGSDVVKEPGPAGEKEVQLPGQRAQIGETRHKRSLRRLSLVVAVLAGATALAAFTFLSHRNESARQATRSIAVLPFENLSGDPQQEYLSDGLTDTVTTGLGQIAGLRVISRATTAHYKHTQKTTPEIARELGVDALVEGSVIRSGNQVRLNIQLIQARNERLLWANAYDRELANVLALEGELEREIAGQVRLRLTPEQEARFAQSQRVDPETYTLYLQGRFYWAQRSEDSLTKAIGYFEQAIARDPGFAPAYAGLADAYVVLPFFSGTVAFQSVYGKAHDAAQKAISLNSSLAEAHNSEAYVRVYRDWNFQGAEEEFRKALALNPNYATAHQWYAELLSLEARHDEAIAEVKRALELDGQSAVVHHQAGQILRSAKRDAEAMEEYNKSLELDPHLYVNYFSIYRIHRLHGDCEKAFEAVRRDARVMNVKAFATAEGELELVCRNQGKVAFLRKSLEAWKETGWNTAAYFQSWDYAALGEPENSLRVLEREYRQRNLLVLGAATDPELEALHADPRFQAFVRKVGVPAAPQKANALN